MNGAPRKLRHEPPHWQSAKNLLTFVAGSQVPHLVHPEVEHVVLHVSQQLELLTVRQAQRGKAKPIIIMVVFGGGKLEHGQAFMADVGLQPSLGA